MGVGQLIAGTIFSLIGYAIATIAVTGLGCISAILLKRPAGAVVGAILPYLVCKIMLGIEMHFYQQLLSNTLLYVIYLRISFWVGDLSVLGGIYEMISYGIPLTLLELAATAALIWFILWKMLAPTSTR